MATTVLRRRLPHAERRAEILAASAAMFRTRGYDAASIDAIAASVGISGPAIYRYFTRKPEILIALIEAAAADVVGAIDRVVATGPQADILDELTGALIDHASRQGDVIALLQSGTAPIDARDRNRLHRVRLDLVAHLGAALNRARPTLMPAEANLHADVALGMVGHMTSKLSQNTTLRAQFRIILRGVLAA
ncbi:MAG: TetR family transcriptional regulator [Sphingomonadales bacterium]